MEDQISKKMVSRLVAKSNSMYLTVPDAVHRHIQ